MAAPAQPAPYPGDRTPLGLDGHLLSRTFTDPTRPESDEWADDEW